MDDNPLVNIPEFNDCQRFLVYQGGQARYDSLYAIFADPGLDTIEQALDNTAECVECLQEGARESAVRSGPLSQRATTLAIVAARIYAEGIYRPLGIVDKYSCLYVFRADTSWGAVMVRVEDANSPCRMEVHPQVLRAFGRELEVQRFPGLAADSYPPVARWDWDSRNRQQYIGIACGAAWCEVGPRGFAPSPLPRADRAVTAMLGRAVLVKGWYDEQLLAVLDDDRRTTTSFLRGRVFPAPRLAQLAFDDTSRFRTWAPAAWVVLDTVGSVEPGQGAQYKNRLNLDIRRAASTAAITMAHLNRVELCQGDRTTCDIPSTLPEDARLRNCGTGVPYWWARVFAANEGPPRYYCVTRRGHEGLQDRSPPITIPGTARWRWMASDEGIWKACGQGCCETLGG